MSFYSWFFCKAYYSAIWNAINMVPTPFCSELMTFLRTRSSGPIFPLLRVENEDWNLGYFSSFIEKVNLIKWNVIKTQPMNIFSYFLLLTCLKMFQNGKEREFGNFFCILSNFEKYTLWKLGSKILTPPVFLILHFWYTSHIKNFSGI